MPENIIDLSIIIPFYKGENFLPRLLSSLHNSALEMTVDFLTEIIVVIDSMESEISLVTSMAEKALHNDSCFVLKVIKNSKNRGVAETRNEGKVNASGRFLTFIDQDDYVGIPYFQTLQKYLVPGYDFFVINGFFEYEEQKLKRSIFSYHIKPTFNKIARSNFLVTPGLLILSRKMDHHLFRQFSKNHPGSDDWALYLDLLSTRSVKYKYISLKLLHYVVHEDNFHHDKFNFLISQIRTIQYFFLQKPRNLSLRMKINSLQFRLKWNLSMITLNNFTWNDFTGFISLFYIEFFSLNNLIGLYWRERTKHVSRN